MNFHSSIFSTTIFAIAPERVHQLLSGTAALGTVTKPAQRAPGAIHVLGILGPESDWYSQTSYEAIQREINRAVADPQVKTIDLIVNSPGGSVMGLPETADVIREANRLKPVRGFVSGVAASAAYWLVSQASTISATPSGEVGSIGVLDLHVSISDALKQSGVEVTAVSSSPEKVEKAPFTVLTDDARAHMQKNVDTWYGDFLSTVRRGRGARVNPTGTYGNGRMLSSGDALREGLVDFVKRGTL